MKQVRNNADREIGLACNPAIILGPGQVGPISDQQVAELEDNAVAVRARHDQLFDILDAKGKRIPAPRPRSLPSLSEQLGRSGGPNYYRRDADGNAVPIPFEQTQRYQDELLRAIAKSLSRTPKTVAEICSLVRRAEFFFGGRPSLDIDTCFDILLDLDDANQAETFDGGYTWARHGTRRAQLRKRHPNLRESSPEPPNEVPNFDGLGLSPPDPTGQQIVPSEILEEAVRRDECTSVELLALGRPYGDIFPPGHHFYDPDRDFFCSILIADYYRLLEDRNERT